MSDKYNMSVNKKIKELRKDNRYTQEKIAEMLGMKTTTYSQMERSGKIPIHILLRLIEIFKVDINEVLLPKKEEEEKPPIDDVLKIDSPGTSNIGVETPPSPLENDYNKLVLSNREENLIIMINNLYPEDKEEIYRMVKVFHDKKHKKK